MAAEDNEAGREDGTQDLPIDGMIAAQLMPGRLYVCVDRPRRIFWENAWYDIEAIHADGVRFSTSVS